MQIYLVSINNNKSGKYANIKTMTDFKITFCKILCLLTKNFTNRPQTKPINGPCFIWLVS